MTTWKTQKIGSFSSALSFLKDSRRVTRSGWNGKGMWLILVKPGVNYHLGARLDELNALPWIGMKALDDRFVPWLASQTDLLADDWHEVLD